MLPFLTPSDRASKPTCVPVQPARDSSLWYIRINGKATWIRFDDTQKALCYQLEELPQGVDLLIQISNVEYSIPYVIINKLTLERNCVLTIRTFTGDRYRLELYSYREVDYFMMKLIDGRYYRRKFNLKGFLVCLFRLNIPQSEQFKIGGNSEKKPKPCYPSSKTCRESLEAEVERRCRQIAELEESLDENELDSEESISSHMHYEADSKGLRHHFSKLKPKFRRKLFSYSNSETINNLTADPCIFAISYRRITD